MNEIKETKIQTPSWVQTRGIDSADKDKTISELKEKITDLEAQNNDLDYLLNSGRNKFEHERNKRLKELEVKINQSLTNEQLLRLLSERLKSEEIKSWWSGCEYINALFIENAKGEEILSETQVKLLKKIILN